MAIAGLLVVAAMLTLATIGPMFRREDPPPWTTFGWAGELVALAIVSALALGLTALGASAIAAFQTGPDYLDLGLLAAVVLVAVVVRRWWRARARSEALEAAAGLRLVTSDVRDVPGRDPAVPAARPPVSASQPPPHRAA